MKNKITKIFLLSTILSLVLIGTISCTSSKELNVRAYEFDGTFIEGLTSNESDSYVKDLIWDYSTVSLTNEGLYAINKTVVKKYTYDNDTAGNRSYHFELNNNLKFSDGKPVTAKDFVFSILLQSSNKWAYKGLSYSKQSKLLGYDEYHNSNNSSSTYFKGVILDDKYKFSLVIDSNYTPYFYELSYVQVYALPMHILGGKDTEIESSPLGSKLNSKGFDNLVDSLSTTGFIHNPKVVTGPYKIESISDDLETVKLTKNKYYKGNYESKVPTIDKIVISTFPNVSALDIASGDITLDTTGLQAISALSGANSNDFVSGDITRNGYGFLTTINYAGSTQSKEVRQAIAHLVDNDQVIENGPYTKKINGDYSLSQWTAIESKDWIESNLNKYKGTIDDVNSLLNGSEYKYNSDGKTLWVPNDSNNPYRYNEDGEILEIKHCLTNNSSTSNDLVEDLLSTKAIEVGIKYQSYLVSFQEKLDEYYLGYINYKMNGTYKYNLFQLGIDFETNYDSYERYSYEFAGTSNPMAFNNSELDQLLIKLREVDPNVANAKEQYLTFWKQYQILWNDLVPDIPLYSTSEMFIANSSLSGVDKINSFWSWANAIAYLGIK